LSPDDPAFQVNPDLDPVPNPDPGLFLWPKIEEKLQLKSFIFLYKKFVISLSLGLFKGSPSYRRSLQPSRSFLPPWILIRIVNPDPDPGTRLSPNPIRIRIWIRIHNTAFSLHDSIFKDLKKIVVVKIYSLFQMGFPRKGVMSRDKISLELDKLDACEEEDGASALFLGSYRRPRYGTYLPTNSMII
jgi:hypothetical protein